MWWEPTNDEEVMLANDVQRLQNWFLERSEQELPIVCGIGSIWNPQKRALVPFVLLNSYMFLLPPFPGLELIPVSEFPFARFVYTGLYLGMFSSNIAMIA